MARSVASSTSSHCDSRNRRLISARVSEGGASSMSGSIFGAFDRNSPQRNARITRKATASRFVFSRRYLQTTAILRTASATSTGSAWKDATGAGAGGGGGGDAYAGAVATAVAAAAALAAALAATCATWAGSVIGAVTVAVTTGAGPPFLFRK